MDDTNNKDQNIVRYLSGELDEKKIGQMERDFLNDSEKEREMKDFARIWEKSSEIKNYEKLDINSDWEKVKDKMGFKLRAKRIPLRKFVLRIAAIFILAFGLAYFFNSILNTIQITEEYDYLQLTANESSKEYTLPDSSVITLNKNSKVVYNNNFGKSNRDLILEGEAFFKVQRNENIPFKVFVESSTIEVLGTSFNIKTADENVLVSVVTGKVAFYETTEKENRVELIKDEQSVFNIKKHSFDEKKTLNVNNMAWRTGMLEFKGGESFAEVIKYLEQYYQKGIVDESGWFSNSNLGGEIGFRIDESLERVLINLGEATGQEILVEKQDENFVIRSNSSN